ncbi:MAG: glutathione S-transferase family protein [Sphingobium sp.]
MPISENAEIEVSAFDWVPDVARGLVKDLRVRWMLEELGLPYRVRYVTAFGQKPEGYVKEQPFEQVPTFSDGQVRLFESGAILIYLGERDDRLLPRETEARARAIGWVCAALSSVEYFIQTFALINGFWKDEEWAKLRRAASEEMARLRLKQVADWLGDREWLEERFTIGDMMMTTVLRIAEPFPLFEEFPTLQAYVARATGRPAFKAALAAQLAGFTAAPPQQAA